MQQDIFQIYSSCFILKKYDIVRDSRNHRLKPRCEVIPKPIEKKIMRLPVNPMKGGNSVFRSKGRLEEHRKEKAYDCYAKRNRKGEDAENSVHYE